jgi:cardiolipin synthase (CMP-forming)
MTTLTLANQLTLLRMLLVPAFVLLVAYGQLGWALIVLVVAGLTDALDGLAARRAGQKTTLGAWLDPMADKLLLTAAFIVLTVPGTPLITRIPLWLTVLIISRDVVIVLTVAIVNLAVGRRTFPPSVWGKVATAIYIGTCLAFVVFNYLEIETRLLDAFVYASLGITVISSLHYISHATTIVNASDDRAASESLTPAPCIRVHARRTCPPRRPGCQAGDRPGSEITPVFAPSSRGSAVDSMAGRSDEHGDGSILERRSRGAGAAGGGRAARPGAARRAPTSVFATTAERVTMAHTLLEVSRLVGDCLALVAPDLHARTLRVTALVTTMAEPAGARAPVGVRGGCAAVAGRLPGRAAR